MTLKLVSGPPPPKKPKRLISAKQLAGVENPATVLLHPVHFEEPIIQWWSYDGILMGGLKVNGNTEIENGSRSDAIAYLPTPVPRSWGEREFKVVVEYECEHQGSIFQMRLHYGCGDPSELHKGETGFLQGVPGSKQRIAFPLDESHLARNELLRCTLEIQRVSAKPILVYGTWLEIGV